MLSLEKFERLINSVMKQREADMVLIGKKAERLQAWSVHLTRLHRSEQYSQIKTVLSEMIVANISDELRFDVLEGVYAVVERLVAQLQLDYVHNPQNPHSEQRACIKEVRSLYFLLILAYKGIADRYYQNLLADSGKSKQADKGNKWLNKLTGSLGSSLVRQGTSIDLVNPDKKMFTLAVYRMMGIYYRLSMEFALTYQRVPDSIWGQMNAWYLKAATQQADRTDVNKLNHHLPSNSIYQKYLQICLASFANLFAYRRADILNIFKILPNWVKYTKSTFTADGNFKIFVNLQAQTPPELITPYATVNPYSSENVCLFFDVKDLFKHLKSLQEAEQSKLNDSTQFESRLAKIVLLAFNRQFDNTISNMRINEHVAEMASGFFGIFHEVAGGRSFAHIIEQSSLPDAYHPKIKSPVISEKELVKVMTKSEINTHFVCGDLGDEPSDDDDIPMLKNPYLPVFSPFALKADDVNKKHPWRLGIIHWAEPSDNQVAVDGRFLGQILAAGGIRLTGRDMRSRDFVQALLLSGDGLHQQATMILPRYHFKSGDVVVFRIDGKESTLRLENNLLSTDDIEQYEIVRLV